MAARCSFKRHLRVYSPPIYCLLLHLLAERASILNLYGRDGTVAVKLTKDEARRIAVNIAELPNCCG
jgi:hypothetical protein